MVAAENIDIILYKMFLYIKKWAMFIWSDTNKLYYQYYLYIIADTISVHIIYISISILSNEPKYMYIVYDMLSTATQGAVAAAVLTI